VFLQKSGARQRAVSICVPILTRVSFVEYFTGNMFLICNGVGFYLWAIVNDLLGNLSRNREDDGQRNTAVIESDIKGPKSHIQVTLVAVTHKCQVSWAFYDW